MTFTLALSGWLLAAYLISVKYARHAQASDALAARRLAEIANSNRQAKREALHAQLAREIGRAK